MNLRTRLDRLDKSLPPLKTAYDKEQEAARAYFSRLTIEEMEELYEINESLKQCDDSAYPTEPLLRAVLAALYERIESRLASEDAALAEQIMNFRPQDKAEAERLKLLSRAEQTQIVEVIRSVADNPRIPEADRLEARTRAEALARLLKLNLRKRA